MGRICHQSRGVAIMPDVFTKAGRSEVMSRIRSRGNRGTEMALATLFRRHGITGWRRHVPLPLVVQSARFKVQGRAAPRESRSTGRVKPDFVFPKLRLAVFVDGCFWHGCPRHATRPKGNAAFWRGKLAANKARDRLVSRALPRAGWRVLRAWEHELAPKNAARLVRRLLLALSSIRAAPARFDQPPGRTPSGACSGWRRVRHTLNSTEPRPASSLSSFVVNSPATFPFPFPSHPPLTAHAHVARP